MKAANLFLLLIVLSFKSYGQCSFIEKDGRTYKYNVGFVRTDENGSQFKCECNPPVKDYETCVVANWKQISTDKCPILVVKPVEKKKPKPLTPAGKMSMEYPVWFRFDDATLGGANFEVFSSRTGKRTFRAVPSNIRAVDCASQFIVALKEVDPMFEVTQFGRFVQFDSSMFSVTKIGRGCKYNIDTLKWESLTDTISIDLSNDELDGNKSKREVWRVPENGKIKSVKVRVWNANPDKKGTALEAETSGWKYRVRQLEKSVEVSCTVFPKDLGGGRRWIGFKVFVEYEVSNKKP